LNAQRIGAKGKQQQETEAAEGPVDDAEKAVMEKILQLSTESEDNKLSDADSKALARAQKAAMKDMKKIIESDCPAEEKLDSVQSKFTTLLAEHKKVERDLLINTRKLEKCTKDKDHAQQEATKLAAVKGKLETLCRELQKQNKAVIDDSRRVQEEEHNKRSELSNKFQETIKDVTVKLDAQGDDRIKQFQENDALREKLKNFAEQYELREQHFAHQIKTKDLEAQLLEAKLKHQTELGAQESAKLQAYKQELEARAKTEIELRQQLSTYSEKFETFQDTLTKSNDVFGTFKKEMDKMTKSIKKLEKEKMELKIKEKKCDVELLNLHEGKENALQQLESQKKQNAQLQSLCKTLQEERKKAREEAKTNQEVVENLVNSDPVD